MATKQDRLTDLAKKLEGLEPHKAASFILQRHGGDPRAAEAEAWELYDWLAGGTWGSRPRAIEQNGAAIAANQICRHIIDKTEEPPVKRIPPKLFAGGARSLISSLVGR